MPFLKLNLTKAIRLSLRDVQHAGQKGTLIRFLSYRQPDILIDIDLKDILQTDQPTNQPSSPSQGGNDA